MFKHGDFHLWISRGARRRAISSSSMSERPSDLTPLVDLLAVPGTSLKRRANVRAALHCREIGTRGPLVVFLHGVGGTTRYFERPVGPLAASHRVLLVDLLGYGRSPKPWRRYTVDRHVAALRTVLGTRGPATLVGHSFGAIAALAYAARYPRDVTGLVLVGMPYFGNLEQALAHYRRRRTADRWLMTNVVLAAITCVVTRRMLGRLLPRLLQDLPREVAEDLVLHTWLSSVSTLWDGIYRYDSRQDADRLPSGVPVLVLHGDQDATAPLDGMRRLMSGRPGWDLRVLPGVDHHALLRAPDLCRRAIAAWVGQSGAGPRAVG